MVLFRFSIGYIAMRVVLFSSVLFVSLVSMSGFPCFFPLVFRIIFRVRLVLF